MNKYNFNKATFILPLFLFVLITIVPLKSFAFISFPTKIDTKEERINIQTVLNIVMVPSPNLVTDGLLGSKSILAIKLFQSLHQLTPDGKVGAMTRAALESAQQTTITTVLGCTSGATFDPQTGLPCATTTSSLNILRTLKLTIPRMIGNDIKDLQTYLNNHGYNVGTPDGVFGTGTSNAIATFQKSNNLTSDGSLGPTTLSYLTKLSPPTTTTTGCLSNTGFNTITGLPCTTTTPSVSGGGSSSGGGGGGGSYTPPVKTPTTDTIPPTITTFTVPTNSTSLTVPITLVATDNILVSEYVITESSTVPSSGFSSTLPTNYIASIQGSHTLYAFVKDSSGNVSISTPKIVNITISQGATATTFTFSGPSSGTVNTASTNFTITPNNPYTGTITITPIGLSPIVKTFSNSSTAQTFTITPNTSGTITLTPTNNGGLTNPTSLTYTSNAVNTVPDAPTGVTATAGNTTASVSFTAPTSNGGSAITTYTVTPYPSAITSTATTSPITVSGLTNGTSYTFTVKATNAIGSSVASSASNAVVPTTGTDTTKPIIDSFSIPSSSTSLTISPIAIIAHDNVGVTGYLLTETSTAPSAGSGSWSSSAPTSYTFGSILGVSKFNFTQNLKQGTTNEEVKQLQIFLNNNGYPVSTLGSGSIGKETSYFGSLTKQAVIKFQQTNKLTADGIIGKATMEVLNK
jgi:peptidoglycan hydrolase-like protein with peptidoglycan-binding domain